MSTASKSLVGKVIKHKFQAFLVLEDLDDAYVGFWATGTYKSEPEEIPKGELELEPCVLADSMNEFVTQRTVDEVAKAVTSKYVGTVCRNKNGVHGLVTGVKGDRCVGVAFDGTEWSAQQPALVARHLVDYTDKKVREQLEKV